MGTGDNDGLVVLPPYGPMPRKKRNLAQPEVDSYRVFGKEYSRYRPPVDTHYKSTFNHTHIAQAEDAVAPNHRQHNPHPVSCTFLRHDVRLLNEPQCTVHTKDLSGGTEQHWFGMAQQKPKPQPPRTFNSTQRADFQYTLEHQQPEQAGRYTAQGEVTPAKGAAPVTSLRPSGDPSNHVLREKISYEHQYNSRRAGNYNRRGRREGAFVWDALRPDEAKRVIEHHQIPTQRANKEADDFWQARHRSAPLPPIRPVYDPVTSQPAGLPSASRPPA